MTKKKMTVTARRAKRPSVMLEIELPLLSDEAAAAVADVLVQLYHCFEAHYYAQILSHHADQVCAIHVPETGRNPQKDSSELF